MRTFRRNLTPAELDAIHARNAKIAEHNANLAKEAVDGGATKPKVEQAVPETSTATGAFPVPVDLHGLPTTVSTISVALYTSGSGSLAFGAALTWSGSQISYGSGTGYIGTRTIVPSAPVIGPLFAPAPHKQPAKKD